jgi:hypothetical protein
MSKLDGPNPNSQAVEHTEFSIFNALRIIVGFLLLAVNAAISVWCVDTYLHPATGHMSGTDMSQYFATALFLVVGPVFATLGILAIRRGTKSALTRLLAWCMLVPTLVALGFILFAASKSILEVF